MASLKFVEQADRVDMQVGVDTAGLRTVSSSLGNLFLLLRPSNDWTKPTYIINDNLTTDCRY